MSNKSWGTSVVFFALLRFDLSEDAVAVVVEGVFFGLGQVRDVVGAGVLGGI